MSPYQKKLEELYKLEFFGMKLGLDNIRALLDRIGNPHRQFESIHVAGTNGKGSVCAMLAAVHQKAGKKTGLYTSPHLVDFRERIKIDGEMISEQEVVSFLKRVWPIAEEIQSTFFEVTTAMAFDHFARNKVDIAIIETGLGGRLDATNVLEKPLATVVTSIGHDHHAQLGPTLEDVAREKAGIFKPNVPAVVNCDLKLRPVFIQKSKEVKAPLTFVKQQKKLSPKQLWVPPFPGAHQVQNVESVREAIRSLPYKIPIGIIRIGIAETSQLTSFRSRLERIEIPGIDRKIWLDVGHNPEAVTAVSAFFRKKRNRPVVIFGIMRDKEIEDVLKTIYRFAFRFIAVAANTDRALPSAELARRARKIGIGAKDGKTVVNAIQKEFQSQDTSDILIAGSHYIVGEILRELSKGSEGFIGIRRK